MNNTSRRQFNRQMLALGAVSLLPIRQPMARSADSPERWHLAIAEHARRLAGTDTALSVLVPDGASASVGVIAREFLALTGVPCILTSAAVDEINTELILQASAGTSPHDVALPATFGLADLAESGAIQTLDGFASRYEPAGFSDDVLYAGANSLHGQLFGYQADGDVYLMFYNRQMLEDEDERRAWREATGTELAPATTWAELDQLMAFFHRPKQGRFGGALFRNPDYVVWEWWSRFHAKGWFPVSDDMVPRINNPAGVQALEELIDASRYQSPRAFAYSLVENWEDFASGRIFCNAGWGGTQKFLRARPEMRDNVVVARLPGGNDGGAARRYGYFNWGWNYTVPRGSAHPELAYLFTLFAASPLMSTIAVREQSSFFDPLRDAHHADVGIRKLYGDEFLAVQREELRNSIPDFNLGGQTEYFDSLRRQIIMALQGQKSAQQALDSSALKWNLTTYKRGRAQQSAQWSAVKRRYPAAFRARAKG